MAKAWKHWFLEPSVVLFCGTEVQEMTKTYRQHLHSEGDRVPHEPGKP